VVSTQSTWGVDELFVLLRQGTYGQILSPNLPTLIISLLF